jgi:hypothetical protein
MGSMTFLKKREKSSKETKIYLWINLYIQISGFMTFLLKNLDSIENVRYKNKTANKK